MVAATDTQVGKVVNAERVVVDRDKGGVALTAPSFPRLLEQVVDIVQALKTQVKILQHLRISNLHVGYAIKSIRPINAIN